MWGAHRAGGAPLHKRSQGGSDFDLDTLVALCHAFHAQTDAPYATVRLVVTPVGAGVFACGVIQRSSKWGTYPIPETRTCGTERLPTWANRP